MKLILFLLKESRLTVITAIAVGLVSGLAGAGLIAVITAAATGTDGSRAVLIAAFLALTLVAFATRILSQVSLVELAQRAVFELRIHLCRQILATPLLQLERIGNARFLASLTDDVTAITDAVVGIPLLFVNIATVVGCLVFMAWLSWKGVLLVIAVMIVGSASYQLLHARAVTMLNRARADQDSLFAHFRAMTRGSKELKLHSGRREVFLAEQLIPTARSLHRNNYKAMFVYAIAGAWSHLLLIGLLGLLVFVYPLVGTFTAPRVTSYTLIMLYMLRPIELIVRMAPLLGRATVALRKVDTLGLSLDSLSIEKDDAHGPPARKAWQRLELRGVVHSYHREAEDRHFVLGPLDLFLQPGEVVFLTGGNGSGKSTLAKVMTGLYIPEKGDVWLDDDRITDTNRGWYRQHFTAIFADFFVFERLAGLGEGASDQRAIELLEKLRLNKKVRLENGSLRTEGLSQGQWKRLALLLAYLEDRPIYVFDEWASDQDPIFREVFYTKLLPELKHAGRAIVVITHDERYFHLADRMMRLEDGHIIDG